MRPFLPLPICSLPTRVLLTTLVLALLTACTEPVSAENPARILVMGDSMMAANGASHAAVADALERALGEPVTDRSVVGARFHHALPLSGAAGMKIAKQYRPANWEFVVMNGGGNDLLFGCGCGACTDQMNALLSADGKTGTIPDLIRKIRADGAKILYAGYLRAPNIASPVKSCRAVGDELDRRLAKMARAIQGVTFVSMAKVVPSGDASYYGLDHVHPSAKGSAAIAQNLLKHLQ